MGKKKKSSTAKVLMILWLITAATALIVTVAYFGEMQEMYTAVTDAAGNGGKDSAGKGTEVTTVADNDGNTKAEAAPTDKIIKDDKKDTAPEGVKSEDKTDNTDKEPGNAGNTGTDNSSAAGETKENNNVESGKQSTEENTGDQNTEKPVTDNGADNTPQDNSGNTGDTGNTNAGDTGNAGNTGNTGSTDEPGDTDPDNTGADPEDEETLVEHAYYYDPDLDANKPIIALSFDDGPSIYTKRVLAALEKYGAKATFFMVGYNLDTYADEVKAVYEAGCEVANHTTDHSHLIKFGEAEIRKKVFDNEEAINKIVPVGEVPLRPPYGDINDTVKKVVNRPMFNWSVDSLDWKTRNADSIVAQIKQDAKDGYIILMHDIYQTTAEATERILPWLIEQGYQVTCISNMFNARGEETKPGHLYRYTDPAPKQE